MLKIMVEPGASEVTLKLEGDLAGTGVGVLEDFWLTARAALSAGAVAIDLSGVSRVDDAGRYLLALIRGGGVRLMASGIEMRELVNSISQDWPAARTGIPRGKAGPRAYLERGR